MLVLTLTGLREALAITYEGADETNGTEAIYAFTGSPALTASNIYQGFVAFGVDTSGNRRGFTLPTTNNGVVTVGIVGPVLGTVIGNGVYGTGSSALALIDDLRCGSQFSISNIVPIKGNGNVIKLSGPLTLNGTDGIQLTNAFDADYTGALIIDGGGIP